MRVRVVDFSGLNLSSIPLSITNPQLHKTVIKAWLAFGRKAYYTFGPWVQEELCWGNWRTARLQGEAKLQGPE